MERLAELAETVTSSAARRGGAPLWMLGLLGVEFLVGMGVNLYVQLPVGGMTQMMNSGPSPLLMVHMMLGMTLGVGALLTLWLALRFGRCAIVCAAVALGGIVGGGTAGIMFVAGGQSNVASLLMAVGFLVALTGYVAELVAITNAAPVVSAPGEQADVRVLVLLNDPPPGRERSDNGLRLAGSLAKRESGSALRRGTVEGRRREVNLHRGAREAPMHATALDLHPGVRA